MVGLIAAFLGVAVCAVYLIFRASGLQTELDETKQTLWKTQDELQELNSKFTKLGIEHTALQLSLPEIREDAIKKSKAVMKGGAYEHLAPFLTPGTNPHDYRFVGDPVDFIVFVGADDIHAGREDVLEKIVFLEIKTGNSDLNKIQRRIRNCINAGRVEFQVFNPEKQ